MATLKLKKLDAKSAIDPRKQPARGAGSSVRKKRPTLAEAQAERAEREAFFQANDPRGRGAPPRNDDPRRPAPRGPRPGNPADAQRPRRDEPAPRGRAPHGDDRRPPQDQRRDPRQNPRQDTRRDPRQEGRHDPRQGGRQEPWQEHQQGHQPGHQQGRGQDPRHDPRQGGFRQDRERDRYDAPPPRRPAPAPGHRNSAFDRRPPEGYPPQERQRPHDGPYHDQRPPRRDDPRGNPHGPTDRFEQRPRRDQAGGAFDRPAKPSYPAGRGPARPPLPPARPASQQRHGSRHRDDDDDDDFQVHVDQPGSLRLSKRISELNLASRREADVWIEKGWVRVDGKLVKELGSRVTPDQLITIDAQAYKAQAMLVTVLINKPVGYVSGQAEDGYEPAVVLVTPKNQWRQDTSGIRFLPHHLNKLAPSGRLDIDSVGLLVLTQDGRVAKQLIGQDSEVEKEYLVRVELVEGQRLSDENLALLNHGLELDGEPLLPATVEWVNDDQLRFVLREGKKRQIRRMCEAVGLKVTGLKRVRIGNVMLGDLPPGQWRYLRGDEKFA